MFDANKIASDTLLLAQKASNKPIPHILLALSGGADSVFLLHVLAPLAQENKITLSAAHLNHQWRTDAADDAAWCQDLCATLGIQFLLGTADEYASTSTYNGSAEEQARRIRREFLHKQMTICGADCIALAHHADDQRETFFIKLLRGSSVHGLAGMATDAEGIIRPLLDYSKHEIISWLKKNNLTWREDSTNQNTQFLRNAIRLKVMPLIESIDNRTPQSIIRTIKQLRQDSLLLTHYIDADIKTLEHAQGEGIYNLALFKTLHDTRQRAIIHRLVEKNKPGVQPSHAYINEIVRFLNHENGGSHAIGQNSHLVKRGQTFFFQRVT